MKKPAGGGLNGLLLFFSRPTLGVRTALRIFFAPVPAGVAHSPTPRDIDSAVRTALCTSPALGITRRVDLFPVLAIPCKALRGIDLRHDTGSTLRAIALVSSLDDIRSATNLAHILASQRTVETRSCSLLASPALLSLTLLAALRAVPCARSSHEHPAALLVAAGARGKRGLTP